MSLLELRNISYNFDGRSLAQLKDISINVDSGKVFAVVGPSGTGKTTLLNIIKKDIFPQSGSVRFRGNLSYVAQESTLDFGRTVFENIELAVLDEKELDSTTAVRNMIEVFGLEYKDHKKPSELSAGQRQRVEFAKALVSNPQLLLLDEPFNNLDQFLKEDIISEIFPIFKERNIAVVFVTHNLEEAYSISDQMVVLAHGKIEQIGTPLEIYNHPASAFVAKFTGRINLFASNVISRDSDVVYLKNVFGEFEVLDTVGLEGKKFLYLAIRPEKIEIDKAGKMAGRVKRIDFRGDKTFYELICIDGNKVLISSSDELNLKINQQVRFCFPLDHRFLLSI